MAVRYVPIDNESVSQEWYSVLKAMRADGVRFNVNEGHRTMARQWYFWRLYKSGRGNLAAYPSPWAPHIRTGRIDHAIDFSNDVAVFTWLSRKGLNPRRTVRGESWHIEVSAAELRAFHARHGVNQDPYRFNTKVERALIHKLLYHRREMAREKRSGAGPRYRKHLKWARFYKARLKRIADLLYTLGRREGWAKRNRGKRQKAIRDLIT